ncbi:MAG: Uma2 family endonuclease [Candidatus Bipolaricaulota bacterium]|nr:Uma2 family endonuclease [Candidatus Bipolaricaulota bacterium]
MKAAGVLQSPVRGAEVWPLSVEAYHTLGEAKLIPERTELLYGFVYHKMSKSPLHSFLVQLLQDLLHGVVPGGFVVRTEQPLTCVDSEPEPDLAVVRGQVADFRLAHPSTAELVIEVCVTSADYDRSKLRAYASAGVKECWLVLGRDKQIEVHRQPNKLQFAERTLHGPGAQLTSTAIPSITVDVSKLLESV